VIRCGLKRRLVFRFGFTVYPTRQCQRQSRLSKSVVQKDASTYFFHFKHNISGAVSQRFAVRAVTFQQNHARVPEQISGPFSYYSIFFGAYVNAARRLKRRFPPPWSVEELNDACFVVRDHSGQALAYVNSRREH
jgi:hypothetical protein